MNNQTFQSFDDFTSTLRNEPIPYPDMESFSKKIYTPKEKRSLFLRLKSIPLSILLVCIGVFVLSTATVSALYSKYTKFIVHNKDGEVALEFSQTSKEQIEKDTKAREIYKKWEYKIDEIKESLQTNEVAFLLITELYELDKYYYPIQQEIQFSSIEQMKSATSTSFIAPTTMPDSYKFLNGSISFETEPIDLEKLYQEAQALDTPYIVQKGVVTQKATKIFLTYKAEEINFYQPIIYVHIREITGSVGYTSTSASIDRMQIITLNDSELLYDPDFPSLTFIVENNGAVLEYGIFGNSVTTKEELVQIAQGLVSSP